MFCLRAPAELEGERLTAHSVAVCALSLVLRDFFDPDGCSFLREFLAPLFQTTVEEESNPQLEEELQEMRERVEECMDLLVKSPGHAVVMFVAKVIEAAPEEDALPTFDDLLAGIHTSLGEELGGVVAVALTAVLEQLSSPNRLFDLFKHLDIWKEPARRLDSTSMQLPINDTPASVVGLYCRRMCLLFDGCMFEAVSSLFTQVVEYQSEASFMGALSQCQARRYIQQRLQTIEKDILLGTTDYETTEAAIAHVLAQNSKNIPQAHFLRYLNCVYHCELEGALEHLYRYFDYVAHAKLQASQHLPGDSDDEEEDERKQEEKKNKTKKEKKKIGIQQYAVLNVAMLHFSFGHMSQALRCIHEAIRVAQQNGDQQCLLQALALLCRVAEARGDWVGAARLISHSLSQSKTLSSEPWMALAKTRVGEDPLAVWAALGEARGIALANGADRNLGKVREIMAAAWTSYGHSELAQLWTALSLSAPAAAVQDASLAAARAVANPRTGDDDRERLKRMGLQRVGADLYGHGTSGGYFEAILLTEFEQAIVQGDGARADRLYRQLTDLSLHKSHHFVFQCRVKIASHQLMRQKGLLSQAFKATTALVEECKARNEQALVAELYLFLCRLHHHSGDFVKALPFALRALSLCESRHLRDLAVQARILLGDLQFRTGSTERAVTSLVALLPHVLEHGSLVHKTDAYVALARCVEAASPQRAVLCLETAQRWAEHIGYKDALCVIYKKLAQLTDNDIEKRNAYALLWSKVKRISS